MGTDVVDVEGIGGEGDRTDMGQSAGAFLDLNAVEGVEVSAAGEEASGPEKFVVAGTSREAGTVELGGGRIAGELNRLGNAGSDRSEPVKVSSDFEVTGDRSVGAE